MFNGCFPQGVAFITAESQQLAGTINSSNSQAYLDFLDKLIDLLAGVERCRLDVHLPPGGASVHLQQLNDKRYVN